MLSWLTVHGAIGGGGQGSDTDNFERACGNVCVSAEGSSVINLGAA